MNRWYLLSCLGVLLSFGVKILLLPPKINDVVKSRDRIQYNKRFVDANPDRTVLFAPSLKRLGSSENVLGTYILPSFYSTYKTLWQLKRIQHDTPHLLHGPLQRQKWFTNAANAQCSFVLDLLEIRRRIRISYDRTIVRNAKEPHLNQVEIRPRFDSLVSLIPLPYACGSFYWY